MRAGIEAGARGEGRFGIVLNPRKGERVVPGEGDRVVVIAEDDAA